MSARSPIDLAAFDAKPQPVSPVPRLALSAREAAKALGIGSRLLWEKTQAGEVPRVKIGGRVLYPVAALEKWLADQVKREVR